MTTSFLGGYGKDGRYCNKRKQGPDPLSRHVTAVAEYTVFDTDGTCMGNTGCYRKTVTEIYRIIKNVSFFYGKT